MTVLSFDAGRKARTRKAGLPCPSAVVTGSFTSPSGSAGTFTGTYRFERLVDQFGHPAAAGVFTGELVDAQRDRIGVGSRRHTAAVVLSPGTDAGTCGARIGPLDVNLLGFMVSVEETMFEIPSEPWPSRPAPRLLASAAELVRMVVSRADAPTTPSGPVASENPTG